MTGTSKSGFSAAQVGLRVGCLCNNPGERIKMVRLGLGNIMAIEITHVRFGSTKKTEDEIVRYKWRSLEDGEVNDSDKSTLVDWIDTKNGKAYVGSGSQRVSVGTVHPASGKPYLKTYADGVWTNNLVNLPRA